MYPNLLAEIAREKVDRQEWADKLGISYNSLNAKINGTQPFKVDECFSIKGFLGNKCSVDYLFEKQD